MKERAGGSCFGFGSKRGGAEASLNFAQNGVAISTSDVMHPSPSAEDQWEGEKACGQRKES